VLNADLIHRTLALLEPEELPELLRLLAGYESAGWISAVEAQQWKRAIDARTGPASLVEDPGSAIR
jgi:hypothetical protein